MFDHSKQSLCNEQDTCHRHFLSTARMRLSTPLESLRWCCHGVASRNVSLSMWHVTIPKYRTFLDWLYDISVTSCWIEVWCVSSQWSSISMVTRLIQRCFPSKTPCLPFFLSFFCASGYVVDCQRFVDSHALSLALVAISSEHRCMRTRGYSVLSLFSDHLEGAHTFRQRQQVCRNSGSEGMCLDIFGLDKFFVSLNIECVLCVSLSITSKWQLETKDGQAAIFLNVITRVKV